MDGVKAENGPPGVGVAPSALMLRPSEASPRYDTSASPSSSDKAVSTLSCYIQRIGIEITH